VRSSGGEPERAAYPVARLLVPALRWDSGRGWATSRDLVEDALELGVGGFILFGGEAGAVRDLTAELHERSPRPLLIASDLERGAGQQFAGATPLPPARALGSLADEETVWRAGELTAREARAMGVNWVYAPVADLDIEPAPPIVGTRAFGEDPEIAGRLLAAWIRGCAAGGALSTAKHFPGHGRTLADSHVELPTVAASRSDLEYDLSPFRMAIQAGVDSLMTAHVVYPALDPDLLPATVSPHILDALLRRELDFRGLVVTDSLEMKGFTQHVDEQRGAVAALAAGCDILLDPENPRAVALELEATLVDGRLLPSRVADSLRRADEAASRVGGAPRGEWGRDEDRRWALRTAVATLAVVRGRPRLPIGPIDLVQIEDDADGPYPPHPRAALPAGLQRRGFDIAADGSRMVAVYSDVRAWKARPGLSQAAREAVRSALEAAPDATVVLFGHPRLADEIPIAANLLAAWGGESLMQEAVAAWLAGDETGLGSATTDFSS
jgi:beta-glucosidase-like glycosyl hydrolase